jgi:resuscitation-promoting factor RpfB
VTYPPSRGPWQQPTPPTPAPYQPQAGEGTPIQPYPTAQFPAATNWNQAPTGGNQAPPGRKTSKGKIALIGAAALMLMCCGVTGIAALVSPDTDEDATATTETTQATATADPSGAAAQSPAAAPAAASPTAAPPISAAATPVVQTRTVTETQKIPYRTRTLNDSSLPKGTRKVTTRGVAGIRTLTYQVTLTDGVQTAKKLLKSEITKAPVTQVVRIGTKEAAARCHPNYSGACVPIASDVDCAGGSGNGPAYVEGPVRIIGRDVYDLDGNDNDGVGCED